MSAFMVSKEHIDLLVALAIDGPRGVAPNVWGAPFFNDNRASRESADAMGELLVKENLSSIHGRYPDTVTEPEGTPGPFEQYWMQPYVFQDRRYRMTVAEAFSAISCYEYQSCEHEEWHTSEARQFCEALRHSLGRCVPGYSDAPWEWTQGEIDKRRARAA